MKVSMRDGPKRFVRVFVLATILTVVFGVTPALSAQGFDDQFTSPVLDPGWSVVAGGGNTYSLTANAGHLRYGLDAMTHFDGFLNGYQSTMSFHSCCTHVPGLELQRTVSGLYWSLESKVSYHMPFANGRGLDLRVYFGNGGPGTLAAVFSRGRDVHPFNALCSRLSQRGMALPNGGFDQIHLQLPPCLMLDGFGDVDTTHYLRLDRAGSVLTAKLSSDGTVWSTLWTEDLGTLLDGLTQRVVITGLSWFVPAGSFVDYDYVAVTVDTTPPAINHVVTGTLGNNGWYTSDVTVAWNVTDTESPATFSCPPGSVTADTAAATFTCTATSEGGTDSQSVTIKRDATSPTIAYSGNAGAYTVDQNINITCAASDALSGLATNTCSSITGPAYSFSLGTNTFSASAEDNAGNTASAATSYSVAVTPTSLCLLTKQFVQTSARYLALAPWKQTLVNALVTSACQKLDALVQRLTPAQKAALISKYKQAVSGLVTLGWLTPAQGATLRTLADAL